MSQDVANSEQGGGRGLAAGEAARPCPLPEEAGLQMRHAPARPSPSPLPVLVLQVLHGAQRAQAAAAHDAHPPAHRLALLHAVAGARERAGQEGAQ